MKIVGRGTSQNERIVKPGKLLLDQKKKKRSAAESGGCLEKAYGTEVVQTALDTSRASLLAWQKHCARQKGSFISLAGYDDPYPVPFDGVWLTAFMFLEKAHREGK